jgi:hypothetical protein
MAIDIQGAAMYTPYAESFIASLARRKDHRQVILTGLRSAGASIQNRIVRNFVREVVAINDVDAFRQTRSKRMARCPHRLRCERIMVAGDQKNRNLWISTLRKSSSKPLPKVWFWL